MTDSLQQYFKNYLRIPSQNVALYDRFPLRAFDTMPRKRAMGIDIPHVQERNQING